MFAFFQHTAPRRPGLMAYFGHMGTLGLFAFAVLDSSPIPTFGGPDILIIFLVATRPHPWYEFAAAATAGSVIGAFITFRLARRAGRAYLERAFGKKGRTQSWLRFFQRWETAALVASTAIPFPFPTSAFFAAAGASNRYRTRKFLAIVAGARAVRYSAVGIVAHYFGRRVIRVFRHPAQHLGVLLIFAAAFVLVFAIAIFLRRREPVAIDETERQHVA